MSPILDPAIEFIGITMRFGDFSALKNINLRLEPHQVHVILGENGAGKSTLVKCLIGYQKQSEGQIVINGSETNFSSPKDADNLGIGMVYQHFSLGDQLTVLEHFALQISKSSNLKLKAIRKEIEKFFESTPFKLDPNAYIQDLSAGEKQKLEILLQLYKSPSILILDEPSSVLTPQEANEVLSMLKNMVDKKQLTLILITHKFRELRLIGDTVSVLRRGEMVGHFQVNEKSDDEIAGLMVGELLKASVLAEESRELHKSKSSSLPPALSINQLDFENSTGIKIINSLNISVRPGEIVGVAGVSGNGQKELVEILSGLHTIPPKKIEILGKEFLGVHNQSQFIGLIPELPLQNASVKDMSVWENLSFKNISLSRSELKKKAEQLQNTYHIKAHSLDSKIRTLSGGNIQRTILARELREDTKLIIASNPCFGLDFKATKLVHETLTQRSRDGSAVLLISEDLDEVLKLSDRILVIFEGKIVYEADSSTVDLGKLGAYMGGKEIA